MQENFKQILQIQELDIKLIRLMNVKRERQRELEKIHALKTDIRAQVSRKEEEILELKKEIRMGETQVKEIQEKIARLEGQQNLVKRMEEFNALTQEITQAGREKSNLEQRLSDLLDKLTTEEELLVSLKENLKTTEENSVLLEKEIEESIVKINEEGKILLREREALIPLTKSDVFQVYERLLRNKRDRVVVPIENRICSGCHILLTPQHENLVRRGDRLVFCEHCSRILYWQEIEPVEGTEAAPRRRRRRAAAAV